LGDEEIMEEKNLIIICITAIICVAIHRHQLYIWAITTITHKQITHQTIR